MLSDSVKMKLRKQFCRGSEDKPVAKVVAEAKSRGHKLWVLKPNGSDNLLYVCMACGGSASTNPVSLAVTCKAETSEWVSKVIKSKGDRACTRGTLV